MDLESPPSSTFAEKRRLVVNTVVNGSSQFAAMLASLVFMPLLVRAFGIGNYGLYMLASSVAAYAALLDLGVGSALTKMVAENTATDDRDAMHGAVASALFFYCVVGLVVALAMVVIGWFSAAIFDVTGVQAELLRYMLWVGAVFQLVYWPASTARHVLAGLQRYDVLAWTGVLASLLGIGATVAALVTRQGPLLLVALLGLATAAVSAVNITAAIRLARIPLGALTKASGFHIKAIFAFSWAVFVVQVSDALFYQQTDRLLLGVFAGAASVGLYEAAAKFNAILTYFSGLTVSAVLPLASSMGAEKRHASLRSLFVRGTKYGAALIAPIAIVLMVFAEAIVVAWLGARFAGQGLVAQVLLLPHILVCLGIMGDAIIISQGKLAKRIPYIFMQAIMNVVISAILIPRVGIVGVAIGTATAHLVDFPIHIRFLLRETGVTLAEWSREVVLPVYPALLLPAAIAWGLSLTGLSATLPGIAVACAIAIGAYWAALFAFSLTEAERIDVAQAVSAVRARFSAGSGGSGGDEG